MQLRGRTALVTGAGSGIGKASALLLAHQGAKVAALSRTVGEVERTAREIEESGGEAIALLADVSQVEQIRAAVQQTASQWGRLDIVVANAGINGVLAPIEELTPEEWDQTLNINLKGTFLTVKFALPYLRSRGGAVVVVSSVNGTRIFSNPGATAYSCSKAGQVAFTKMAALELARYGIRVNVVCPGWVESDIDANTYTRNLDKTRTPTVFPEGRIPLTGGKPGTSEQVAQLILFLVSDAASHITGTEVWIDGAESLLEG